MRYETDRLIIAACSARKAPNTEPMPAIKRYTGVAYMVMNRYVLAKGSLPRLWIVSAKHGLIGSSLPITSYNVRMTKDIAEHARPENNRRLRSGLTTISPKKVFVFLGKTYRQALDLSMLDELEDCEITHANGGIGTMLGQFKEWLYAGSDQNHREIRIDRRRCGGEQPLPPDRQPELPIRSANGD